MNIQPIDTGPLLVERLAVVSPNPGKVEQDEAHCPPIKLGHPEFPCESKKPRRTFLPAYFEISTSGCAQVPEEVAYEATVSHALHTRGAVSYET